MDTVTLRRGLVATLVVLAAALAAPAWGQPESWPMLQGGPAHVGAAPGAVSPPLRLAWRSPPSGDDRIGSVAVASGLAVGVASTRVIAMDPATGRLLWTVDRATGPITAPALDAGLGSGGVLVFTEGDGPGKSALVGLDLSTRNRLWSVKLGDLARGSPTIEGERAFVGSLDANVYAVDAVSGKLLWKVRTSGAVDATPAVSGGKVFVVSEVETSGDVRLAALDVSTGRSRWSYVQPRAALGPSSATVADGVVYVGFGDLVVRAFDSQVGTLRWSKSVRASFSYRSSLAFAGGSVYALDDAGGVYRLEAETGDLIWEFRFPADTSWSSPLIADGHVYLAMDDGTVAAIDVPTGHLVWKAGVGGQIGGLAPAGDLLLAPRATGGGGLLAFGHDPAGVLKDEPSPTDLNLPLALATYAVAVVIVTAALILLFRFAIRRRRPLIGTDADLEGAEP